MPSIQQSWTVTTDCVLQVDTFDVPFPRFFSCTVTAAAGDDIALLLLPDIAAIDSGQLGYVRDSGGYYGRQRDDRLHFGDEASSLGLEPWPDAIGLAATYLDLISNEERRVRRSLGDQAGTAGLIAVLLNDIKVPVFGSPPKDWATLGQTLTSTVSGGGAAMAVAAQGNGVVAIATGIGVTVLVKVTFPVADAFGQGLAAKVRERFGLPDSQAEPDE